MKRSDMLNIIAAIVNDEDGYPPAYRILDTIEQAGMLPPKYTDLNNHEDYCSTYDGDDCTCNPYSANEWEKE